MTRLIRVTKPQARAVLTLLRLVETPSTLDRDERKALTHLERRLRLAVDGKPIHPLTVELDRLEGVLLSTRSRAFHDFVRVRLRDLLSAALLWRGAEELPRDIALPLLVIDRAGDGDWAAEVLDQAAAHGLLLRLPGDEHGTEGDDDHEGDQR